MFDTFTNWIANEAPPICIVAITYLFAAYIYVSAYVFGTAPKEGRIFKYKTINGLRYCKRAGLLYSLSLWRRV